VESHEQLPVPCRAACGRLGMEGRSNRAAFLFFYFPVTATILRHCNLGRLTS
jgi:hypothetical protein